MVKCWENICNIQFSHNFCGKGFSTLLEKVQTVSLKCIKHIGSMDSFKVGLRQVYFSLDLAQKRLMGFFLLPVVDLLQFPWQQKMYFNQWSPLQNIFCNWHEKLSRLSLLWCMAIHYIDGREPHANKPVWAICRKQNISFKMWSMICRQIWCRSLSRP